MNEAVGKLLFTAFCLLLGYLAFYLIKQKLANADFSVPWLVIILIALVAFVLFALSLLSWFSYKLEEKFILQEAEFLAVQSEGIAQSTEGETIFYWTLTCQWKDSVGQLHQAKSPVFEGSSLFYNHEKILVRVDPNNPNGLHFVDLSYLSSTNQNGISIITEDEVRAALSLHSHQTKTKQQSLIYKMLQGPLQLFERNKALFILASTLTPLFLALGALLIWWFRFKK